MPSIRRIRPQSRPLRPPLTKQYRATRARFFARNTQLLLVSPSAARPQIGFLAPGRPTPLSPIRAQVSRLVSTETKRFIKEQSWLAGKYTVIGAIVCSCGLSWAWMLTQEMVDREFPAPKEWSFLTKVVYHAARGLEVPGANERGSVDWSITGLAYRDLLRRLENQELDGKGLRPQEDGDVIIPGMGHTGFDIEGKSYEWRRGYYDALMGCGRAAIQLEDAVLDTTRNYMFRRRHMIGPSNPKPKRLHPKAPPAPLEENCVPAYAPPETYYLKILTTKGFTAKEKMDAALAYGAWLDFKGLNDTAEEMYQWALDLATSGVPNPAQMLNRKTAILKPDVPVSANVLDATTAFALHRAQLGDTNAALPVFLSILRARREAPAGELPPLTPARTRETKVKKTDVEVMQDQVNAFWSLLQASQFPAPAPSGDEPFVRTPDTACDEAAVMAYVGEILYATAPGQRDAGLAWTRSAMDLAYASYQDPRASRASKIRSVDCLLVGAENRRTMVELRRADVAARLGGRERAFAGAPWWSWRAWVPAPLVERGAAALRAERDRWEREYRDAGDFQSMLLRGRVFDVREEAAPVWGTVLLREWIIPRFSREEWKTT